MISKPKRMPLAIKVGLPVVVGAFFVVAVSLGATDFSSREDITAQPGLTMTPAAESAPGSEPGTSPEITVSPTPVPSGGEAPEVPSSIDEARSIAEEALQIARGVSPEVYLFTVIYGEQNMYGFVSPDGENQVSMMGEGNDPNQWEVSSRPFLPKPALDPPPPLDFKVVERSPSEALMAFAEKVGAGADTLRVQLQADLTSDGEAFWSAIPTGPSASHGWLCVLTEPSGEWIDPC